MQSTGGTAALSGRTLTIVIVARAESRLPRELLRRLLRSGRRGALRSGVVQRVKALAGASEIAPPTPELCLIAGLIIAMTHGKPAKVRKLAGDMRSFVDAHRQMSTVVRLRGAEHDAEVLDAMDKAANWLDRIEPFLVMMAKR